MSKVIEIYPDRIDWATLVRRAVNSESVGIADELVEAFAQRCATAFREQFSLVEEGAWRTLHPLEPTLIAIMSHDVDASFRDWANFDERTRIKKAIAGIISGAVGVYASSRKV